MSHRCPLCLHTLGSWGFCENCTTDDDYYEKCRLCNPCELHRGCAVRIECCNYCLEDMCDSQSICFPCFSCHYDKCDQWENKFDKNPKHFSSFLRDWYRRDLKLLLEEGPDLNFNC